MKKLVTNPDFIIIGLTILLFVLVMSSCSKQEFTTYWPYIQQSGTIDINEEGEFYHNHYIKYDYRYSCYYSEDTFHNNFWSNTGVGSDSNLPEPDVVIYTNTKYNLSSYIMPSHLDSIVVY
jgi:hypothetical protein